METPNQAPDDSVQDTATSLFGDATNTAVENQIAENAASDTGSTTEPVAIPSVADFTVPDGGTTHVDDPAAPAVVAPVVPATPVVAAPVVAAAPAVAPVQYTPEQIAAFQQWQAAQAQQVIPQAPVQPVQHNPQAPRQQQQLTQPEIDQALNRYTVAPEEFNALFNEPDPAKATAILNGMFQKVVVQAVTMAHHLIQDQGAQLKQQVAPYMQFADTQREVMLREQFFLANPDLKGQDLLIQNVMSQLALERQKGVYQPASEQQVFSDVATRTKALIASLQQQGQALPTVAGAPAQQAAPAVKPGMARLPGGGGGGSQSAANGTAAAGQNQTAMNIFG
jgi:hypothetical protein